jgi:hypothetical protein
MMHDSVELRELKQWVLDRTGRRVRDLHIELDHERIVLRGCAASYYVKQLAQQGIRERLPEVSLENAIVVNQEAN